MASVTRDTEHQAKTEHHEQQAGSAKAKERQCHTGQRECAGHCADIDDDVGHDQPEHTGDDQAHGRVTEPIDH